MAASAATLGARIGAAALLAAVAHFSLSEVASAQPYGYGRYAGQSYAYPPAGDDGAQAYPPQPYCCVLPQGTAVAVQLVDRVGTDEAKAGDRVALRLAAPVIVDGQVVLPAGTPGVGHVVQASGAGLGGKGAKLVVSADELTVGGGIVPLAGMQLTGAGKDHSVAADIASLGGWFSLPLGFVGFAVTGGEIQIPAGTNAAAKVAKTVDLRPLGAATRDDYDRIRGVFGQPDQSRGWIDVPPPPRGMAQVVFFRAKSVTGFGQWFNVREHGQALGKLTNGAYFVVVLPPGQHEFSASSEPEFKDHLTLKVDAGETYYVEGAMTHGVVIGVADLTPSDKARFDAVSGVLQASTPPEGSRIAG